jgi:alanine racemase
MEDISSMSVLESVRPLRMEIDLAAPSHNLRLVGGMRDPRARVIASVKANADRHGVVGNTPALERLGNAVPAKDVLTAVRAVAGRNVTNSISDAGPQRRTFL